MTKEHSDQTKAVQGLVDRLRAGDESAREELIRVASDRLLRLTRKLKGGYQASVGRWEQTEDIFQRSTLRLYQSLAKIELNDAAHFFNLAATQIRRELIDLARHYQGAEGLGANHLTQMALAEPDGAEGRRPNPVFDPAEETGDPRVMQEWSDFHKLIEDLPEQLREVVNLLWYHGMTQEGAAEVLQTSTRNVRRHWRTARLALHEKLGGRLPGE